MSADHNALISQSDIACIIDKLEGVFGVPVWRKKNPLDELMITLLSQNTNDSNRDNAFRNLRSRFDSWDAVRDAAAGEIEAAIRSAGLSKQKSARMKEILDWVAETFGGMSIDGIGELTDDDALKLLVGRKGIGIKTAAVVLALAFDRDLCPVDTHVHRIARRLGWVRDTASAAATFHALRRVIPSGKAATFHLNLLKFGRTICTARQPGCEECPLWHDCSWAAKGWKRN